MALITRNFLLLWLTKSASGFVVRPTKSVAWCSRHVSSSPPLLLPMSSSRSSDDDDDEGQNSLDAMRRLLEESWDEDTMGKIPDSPEAAANEAGRSLLSARDRGHSLMMVNLLLPSYDITQGPSFYDEVEAVSFCVALGKLLESKTCIVVRDNKTRSTVTRVLDARESAERELAAAQRVTSTGVEDDFEDDEAETEEDEEDNDDVESKQKTSESSTEDDDNEENDVSIGEFGSRGDTRTGDSTKSELSDFRKQLLSDWDGDTDETPSSSSKLSKQESNAKTSPSAQPAAPTEKNYRLTSMFGDAIITPGADMFEKVIQAVSVNAQPKEDEDTLIVLSTVSQEETIGVRALASKFKKTKTIVLVNCKFDPTPVEIVKAEIVYSLLPLAARPNGADNNGSSPSNLPKVVVLRRFPRDFEVFMDFGNGFELTESVSTSQVGKGGPSLGWIAERLKKQMDARY